jgi:hypothetical protein
MIKKERVVMRKWSVVVAGFLLILGTTTVWAECGPKETLETVTGTLQYDQEAAQYLDTPYSLSSQGRDYTLYPDGPYFGDVKWDDPGYVENAMAKLSGFVGRQVRVTGCTSTVDDGQFHEIGKISQVMLA